MHPFPTTQEMTLHMNITRCSIPKSDWWVSPSNQVATILEFQSQHRPSNEYSGLIFFRIDWFDLLAVQLKWAWVWVSSGRWWRTGKPGVLQSMGPQRVRHNLATEQQQYYIFTKTPIKRQVSPPLHRSPHNAVWTLCWVGDPKKQKDWSPSYNEMNVYS